MGQLVSAAEARRILKRLQVEQLSLRRLARVCGLKSLRLRGPVIRLRQLLRWRWLARKWLGE